MLSPSSDVNGDDRFEQRDNKQGLFYVLASYVDRGCKCAVGLSGHLTRARDLISFSSVWNSLLIEVRKSSSMVKVVGDTPEEERSGSANILSPPEKKHCCLLRIFSDCDYV